MDKTRQIILGIAEDLAIDFVYYDRKEDEDLPRGVIEKAIKDKVIYVDEIVTEFRNGLVKQLSDKS